MNYPDWKDYETGAMSPAERAAADDLLSTNEGARLDYAAYQEYRTTLRQAVLAEGARADRLESFLQQASPRRSFPRWGALAAVGAAALAVAFVAPKFMAEDKVGPAISAIDQIAHLQTEDPVQAAQWVNQKVSFVAPTYRLANVAHITGAECGNGWGAYLYNCGKKKARLIIRPHDYKFENAKPVTVGKTTFYVGKTVGWKCSKCAYEIEGCDEQTRMLLAKEAAKELFGRL